MRIGSLFTGYGGLDHAAEAAFGATTAWVSDIDKGACKLLAHRYPDVPNIGDITAADWAAVEPVDIITGGSPCQDLSHAGRRAGMTEGTRSNLWVAMREAIAQIRPEYVVWENVRGAYSAGATSELEPCAGCVGDGSATHLRALGRVLGDLSDLGYDAQWRGLRAADVGAPHGRFRVFVVARLADAERGGRERIGTAQLSGPPVDPSGNGAPASTDATSNGRHEGWAESAGIVGRPDVAERGSQNGRLTLLPSPRTSDTNGAGQHGGGGMDLRTAVTLLPTPAVNDMGKAYTPEEWDAWTAKMQAAHGNGNGHGKSLEIEAARLLPTPVVTDAAGTRNATANRSNPESTHHAGVTLTDALLPTPSVADVQGGRKGRSGDRSDELLLNGIAHEQRFGQYAPAISRWESVIEQDAPAPTEPTGRGGARRLSPKFTEWMMGLPAGWITDVPGITRNEALKLCGNGVVPQQAFAAITDCLRAEAVAA